MSILLTPGLRPTVRGFLVRFPVFFVWSWYSLLLFIWVFSMYLRRRFEAKVPVTRRSLSLPRWLLGLALALCMTLDGFLWGGKPADNTDDLPEVKIFYDCW